MHTTRGFSPGIYPPLLERCEELASACEARGVVYWATSGLRTRAEQDALYALGRSTPNVDATPGSPLGGIVTRARGGQSFHNFGLAVDFALDASPRAGLQPSWDSARYMVLGEEARRLGLEWGGDWILHPGTQHPGDYPHVQWPGVTLADCQREFARGGLQGLWVWIDRR